MNAKASKVEGYDHLGPKGVKKTNPLFMPQEHPYFKKYYINSIC
jgi:hypothetical protein